MPVVAVVGRPNVGKSTFFNRVIGQRVAIVDDTPGVTRDRNFARADWAGRNFFLVDTGGVIEGSNEPLERAIREQAYAAVEESDLILFLADGKTGVHPLDERLAEILRKSSPPVLLVVNKMDRIPEDQSHLDFWRLGMGDPLPVSAISGRGSGDLLDAVVANLPEREETLQDEGVVRIAVIGKPNVGKSSFINCLFGEDRVVVNAEAGTTRDPIDTPLQYHGHSLVFVDTAGLRRQSRVKDSLEYYASLRTAKVVRDADVCLVLVDATEPIHVQDLKVAEQAWEAGAGVILVANKWDLVQKDHRTAIQFEKDLQQRAPFLKWIPVMFTSALSGQRVRKCLDQVLEVQKIRHQRVSTAKFNQALESLIRRQPPPHSRGRRVKLRYGTQVSVAPPTFIIFSNLSKALPEHYIRYVHNSLRDRWGFVGSPIRIRFREN
ncbi:MAG: ribosome biogenesis GTPase Der [Gemmatimonadota bacterium]|nr:ribosome biogenesis GTPase Der [Gemmatimonadota bacterium]